MCFALDSRVLSAASVRLRLALTRPARRAVGDQGGGLGRVSRAESDGDQGFGGLQLCPIALLFPGDTAAHAHCDSVPAPCAAAALDASLALVADLDAERAAVDPGYQA